MKNNQVRDFRNELSDAVVEMGINKGFTAKASLVDVVLTKSNRFIVVNIAKDFGHHFTVSTHDDLASLDGILDDITKKCETINE